MVEDVNHDRHRQHAGYEILHKPYIPEERRRKKKEVEESKRRKRKTEKEEYIDLSNEEIGLSLS